MSMDDWGALLDRLEKDARRVLASAPGTADAADIGPWSPPDTPMPPELADRAREIVELQRAAMERARTDLDEIRGHIGAVGRIPSTQRPDAPAYLDVDG